MRNNHSNIREDSSASSFDDLSSFRVSDEIGLFTFYKGDKDLKKGHNLGLLHKGAKYKKHGKTNVNKYEKKQCCHQEKRIEKFVEDKRSTLKPEIITLNSKIAPTRSRNCQK